jgi:hypothetical protein
VLAFSGTVRPPASDFGSPYLSVDRDTADRFAPQRTRLHPIARELVAQLDRWARRRGWGLDSLCNGFGLDRLGSGDPQPGQFVCGQGVDPGVVRSGRDAVSVFRLVRFLGPPPEPGVPIIEHRALHKPRWYVVVPHAAFGQGEGIRAPR